MKRLILTVAATLFVFPAFAQSTITLDDLEPTTTKPADTARDNAILELEECLLDRSGCKNAKLKSSAQFSIDDVVNLGIIDRTKIKPASATQATVALPSIDMEILFDYDSADLRVDELGKLAQLSQVLSGRKFQNFRLLFLGHTDAKGSPAYNRTLSQKRAQSVASFVGSRLAISAERILATGLGASKLKDLSDPFGPQNRRVQLVLIPTN